MADKAFKPISIKEHLFHVILVVVTGGVWAVIWLLRVFLKQREINKMTPEQKASVKQKLSKNNSAGKSTDAVVPKQVLEYKKRTFASTAEAEEDYYSDYADDYAYQITGESFYRDNLMGIIRKHNAFQEGELMLDAILVLEPENEFDPTAVAVFIDGKKVGHIPKDDSMEVTEYIEDRKGTALKVKGVIGWNTASSNPPIGVRLDFNF